jgi:hypothetical protein
MSHILLLDATYCRLDILRVSWAAKVITNSMEHAENFSESLPNYLVVGTSLRFFGQFRFSISVLEGFQKWIIRADYLPDNPMDTRQIKFTETIKRSRQIINPRCKFVSCGVNGLPSTKK